MLSDALQTGKAAEHFVCTHLILQGYNAFLADQGLPYDVVVDDNNVFYRVQVKATKAPAIVDLRKYAGVNPDVYRFGLRRGAKTDRRLTQMDADVLACVMLDKLKVGYLPVSSIMNKSGVKMLLELRTRETTYLGRVYSNGKVRKMTGKFIEDYADFGNCINRLKGDSVNGE